MAEVDEEKKYEWPQPNKCYYRGEKYVPLAWIRDLEKEIKYLNMDNKMLEKEVTFYQNVDTIKAKRIENLLRDFRRARDRCEEVVKEVLKHAPPCYVFPPRVSPPPRATNTTGIATSLAEDESELELEVKFTRQ